MCLDLEHEQVIDFAQPINQGVTADRVAQDRRGLRVREITFQNPCDGQIYVYLTFEMTLKPGLLVLLYKTRWEIEKVFDETKTRLQEQKSWTTTPTAKEMQVQFVALVHNLLLLVQACTCNRAWQMSLKANGNRNASNNWKPHWSKRNRRSP